MRPRSKGPAIVLAAALLAIATPGLPDRAHADPAAQARFLDDLAREAYARGRHADALALFLESHAAAPGPRTLYNVALCAALTGNDALAYTSFAEYLGSDDPHPARRDDAERRIATLARRLALVRVESDPPGATIFVDRRELGGYGTTPRTIVVEPGAHSVELAHDDHHVARVAVVAEAGATREARATLAARTGRVRNDVSGAGEASVVLERDGASLPIAGETEVPVGPWRARVSAPGMRDEVVALAVAEDRLERREVVLERLPAPTGRLLIRTADVAARVTIDGVPRAETPARLELPAGEHEVAIEAPGHVRWARRVAIAEDRTLRLDLTLVPQ